MNRFLARAVTAVMVAALLFPVDAEAISAEKSILLDANTGRVLYAQNADSRSLIASTTKIMTALVVSEQCNVLDRVRIPKEAVGIEGSSMYLQEGEVLTVQELLYGLMLRSGNDAAVALAIYCGGTVEGFAGLMNDKAALLELDGTHFVNPHGLDAPGHYSCASDLATLAAYAMNNPIFAMTVSTKTVTIGDRSLRNHNKLLWQLDGAEGVKTGYTKAAGRILVSSVMRQGRRLVAVTINAPDDWNDHKWLMEKGFSGFSLKQIVSAGDVLGSVEVSGGQAGCVELIANSDFSYALAPEEKITLELPGVGFVYAPVKAFDDAGEAHVLIDGKQVGSISLIYGQTVEIVADERKPLIDRLKDLFH